MTVIIVSQGANVAEQADRVLQLTDGRIRVD
jgi:predicted ABC-type transport system involved in lysophospholipase L1 biosynthesis ATPase subunit